jgi:GNAT superfamily N-acetyltransferase
MSITFQQEPFATAYRDAEPELHRHYDEIAEDKEIIGPIDPDLETYEALDKKDRLRVLTARDNGKLVGYYVAIIGQNMHYKKIRCAIEDMYYLAPEYRKGSLGIRLFVEAEKMVRASQAVITLAKTKVAHDHGIIFKRLGYRPFESVYMKVLGA